MRPKPRKTLRPSKLPINHSSQSHLSHLGRECYEHEAAPNVYNQPTGPDYLLPAPERGEPEGSSLAIFSRWSAAVTAISDLNQVSLTDRR